LRPTGIVAQHLIRTAVQHKEIIGGLSFGDEEARPFGFANPLGRWAGMADINLL